MIFNIIWVFIETEFSDQRERLEQGERRLEIFESGDQRNFRDNKFRDYLLAPQQILLQSMRIWESFVIFLQSSYKAKQFVVRQWGISKIWVPGGKGIENPWSLDSSRKERRRKSFRGSQETGGEGSRSRTRKCGNSAGGKAEEDSREKVKGPGDFQSGSSPSEPRDLSDVPQITNEGHPCPHHGQSKQFWGDTHSRWGKKPLKRQALNFAVEYDWYQKPAETIDPNPKEPNQCLGSTGRVWAPLKGIHLGSSWVSALRLCERIQHRNCQHDCSIRGKVCIVCVKERTARGVWRSPEWREKQTGHV